MLKAVIVIDDYKIDTFKRILTANGFTFDVVNELMLDTLTLTVHFDKNDIQKLHDTVSLANRESARLYN